MHEKLEKLIYYLLKKRKTFLTFCKFPSYKFQKHYPQAPGLLLRIQAISKSCRQSFKNRQNESALK